MQSQGSVTDKIIDGVATITFSHPQANSLPNALLTKLADAVNRMARSKEVSVIIIESEGITSFCAGASFTELSAISTLAEATNFFMGFADVMLAMKHAQQPVIVAVQGKTVGGGVGIIAAADWVIAEASAQIRLSELSVGIGPFTISPVIIRKIGIGAFQELTFSTVWKDAAWCQRNCLFNTIVDHDNDFEAEVMTAVRHFRSFDKNAFYTNKKLLWSAHLDGHFSRDTFLLRAKEVSSLLLSPYAQEKIKRIKEKQP